MLPILKKLPSKIINILKLNNTYFPGYRLETLNERNLDKNNTDAAKSHFNSNFSCVCDNVSRGESEANEEIQSNILPDNKHDFVLW